MSVCPLVYRTMHCGYFDTTQKGNHSSFLTPTVLGGQHLFRLKFALKAIHFPSKNADRFPLIRLSRKNGSYRYWRET